MPLPSPAPTSPKCRRPTATAASATPPPSTPSTINIRWSPWSSSIIMLSIDSSPSRSSSTFAPPCWSSTSSTTTPFLCLLRPISTSSFSSTSLASFVWPSSSSSLWPFRPAIGLASPTSPKCVRALLHFFCCVFLFVFFGLRIQ